MCAVYPWQSPGGWRLLGRTPVPMFAASETESPSLLASGDRVRWQAIAPARYLEMPLASLPFIVRLGGALGLNPGKIVEFNRDGALLARFFFMTDPDGYKIEVLQRHGRYK